jgi:RNA polymerase sigma-70 factor (ECF subfamily)
MWLGGNTVSRESILVPREPAGFRARSVRDVPEGTTVRVSHAVARAKEGDERAFAFIYAVYANSVYGYVRSIVRDHHEAEDLTQHVFAKLMTAIAKYDDQGVPFFAWLLRLARNVTIDHVRSRRPTLSAEVIGLDRAASTDVERQHAVDAALDTLSDDQRRVIMMRHVIGLSPSEIADQMGRSEGSIHGLHHRGRLALKRELTRLESGPFTVAANKRQLEHAA